MTSPKIGNIGYIIHNQALKRKHKRLQCCFCSGRKGAPVMIKLAYLEERRRVLHNRRHPAQNNLCKVLAETCVSAVEFFALRAVADPYTSSVVQTERPAATPENTLDPRTYFAIR